MRSPKEAAIVIGVLFLVALVLNPLASSIMDPILRGADCLNLAYPHKHTIALGNILNIICAIAMIFIPIFLYPIVHAKHRTLAVGYIVFRGLEGILFVYIAIKTSDFIGLSHHYLSSSFSAQEVDLSIANLLHEEIQGALVIDLIHYIAGAVLFYLLMLRSKMIPLWITLWGLLGVVVLLFGTTMAMFEWGLFKTTPLMAGMVYFAPPIAINELALSIWLMTKGFDMKYIYPNNYKSIAPTS